MLTLSPCPPSDEEYCLNGGECLYLMESPTTYVCSCFMPFYGTRCEYEALVGGVQEIESKNRTDWAIRKSIDRAMTVTALIFIVSTFLGVILLAWYLSRRRRLDYAQWKREHEVNISNRMRVSTTECGVQVDSCTHHHETAALTLSNHSMVSNGLPSVVGGVDGHETAVPTDSEIALTPGQQMFEMTHTGKDSHLYKGINPFKGESYPTAPSGGGLTPKRLNSMRTEVIGDNLFNRVESISTSDTYVNAMEVRSMLFDRDLSTESPGIQAAAFHSCQKIQSAPRSRKKPLPLPKEEAAGVAKYIRQPQSGSVKHNTLPGRLDKQPFSVASQHDALLSDLLNRGKNMGLRIQAPMFT